jgi:hypothetical protein
MMLKFLAVSLPKMSILKLIISTTIKKSQRKPKSKVLNKLKMAGKLNNNYILKITLENNNLKKVLA